MGAVLAAVGWIGAGVLLAAYALASTRRITAEGLVFQLMNLLGALALTTDSGYHRAWPSAVLNAAWITIGLAMLARRSVATPASRGVIVRRPMQPSAETPAARSRRRASRAVR